MLALYSNCPKYKKYGRLSFSFCPSYCQLTREDNAAIDKTFVYQYNNIGNVTAVKSYSYITGTPSGTPVTTSFGYSGDKLTSFGNKSITYNSNGGVTSYDGWNYTWSKGDSAL